MNKTINVGVLALQGAFYEHMQLLQEASQIIGAPKTLWNFFEVRTKEELAASDALIIPGGESTTMSLVAERSGMLEPLRDYVKAQRRPTWGTCAGMILLSESADRSSTKQGGQELIGGLDVRVTRNYFGRQTESFEADLNLPFLNVLGATSPFHAIFIRAPVVEKVLPVVQGEQKAEIARGDMVVAPAKLPMDEMASKVFNQAVEIMGVLPGRKARIAEVIGAPVDFENGDGDIVAVRQGNVFGTSFHPELTRDPRIHVWWLQEVLNSARNRP